MNKPVEIMSTIDFLAWSPPDERFWKSVDGEPCAMAPTNRSHGAIRNELDRRLGLHHHPDGAGDLIEGGELFLETAGFRAPLASLYRTTRLAAR